MDFPFNQEKNRITPFELCIFHPFPFLDFFSLFQKETFSFLVKLEYYYIISIHFHLRMAILLTSYTTLLNLILLSHLYFRNLYYTQYYTYTTLVLHLYYLVNLSQLVKSRILSYESYYLMRYYMTDILFSTDANKKIQKKSEIEKMTCLVHSKLRFFFVRME